MVDVLYSFIDLICFLIIFFLYSQTQNIGKYRIYYRFLLICIGVFSIVDCIWGLIASNTILDYSYLKFASTLFYAFSSFSSYVWLRFTLLYTELENKIKFKKTIHILLLIPFFVLIALLIYNSITNVIFYIENNVYHRGVNKYVIITYCLQGFYFILSFLIAIIIRFTKIDRSIKFSITVFSIFPILSAVLQLLHSDKPYYAIGFMMGCLVIFVFDVVQRREKNTEDNLQERYDEILKRCNEVLGQEFQVEENINTLLSLVASYYDADRVLLMENDKQNSLLSCSYEFRTNKNDSNIKDIQLLSVKDSKIWLDLFSNKNELYREVNEELKENNPECYEYFLKNKINTVIGAPLQISGEIIGIIGIDNPKKSVKDYIFINTISIYIYSEILRRNRIEEEQKTNKAVLVTLTDSYSVVFYVDVKTDEFRQYRCNGRAKKYFGNLKEKFKTYTDLFDYLIKINIDKEDLDEMFQFCSIANLTKKLKNKKSIKKQICVFIEGCEVYYEIKYVKVDEENQPLTAFVVALSNIDEQVKTNELIDIQQKKIEKQQQALNTAHQKVENVKRISNIDNLTGVYNKISGQNFMYEYVKNKPLDEKYSLMFIDIDKFKNFNDKYGHLVGDEVLIAVGNVIKSICRNNDIAVRFGGDEFLILLKDVGDKNIANSKVLGIRNGLKDFSQDKDFDITCSIGVCISDSSNLEEIIDNADKALYQVKNTTRNDVRFYE